MNVTSLAHVAEATLAELADGDLLTAKLSAPERRHLETCDRCRSLIEGHRRAGQLLAAEWQMVALGHAVTDAGAPTRVASRVGAGQLLGGPQSRPLLRFGPSILAVGLLIITGFVLWTGGGPPVSAPGPSASPSPVPSAPSPVVPSDPPPSPRPLSFQPQHLAIDPAGRVYVTDCAQGRVLRIDGRGLPAVSVAGIGMSGRAFSGDGGLATEAPLECPYQIAFDGAGDLYIADTGNNRVRKVDAAGVISTVAGSGPAGWGRGGFDGDGGPATEALLRSPAGIAFDREGNLYIADMWNNRIRMVDTDGIITTIAGDGALFPGYGGDGGPALQATLKSPQGIAVDGTGNVYFVDSDNNRLRMIDTTGTITTIAGTGELASYGDGGPANQAALALPRAVLVDGDGNIYVSEAVWDMLGQNPPGPDGVGNRVRRIDAAGIIHAFAGSGEIGYTGDEGPATEAQLNGINQSFGLAIDGVGNVYIADSGNQRIRVVDTSGVITTFADGSALHPSQDARQPTAPPSSASHSATTPVPLPSVLPGQALVPGEYEVVVSGQRISFTVPEGWASVHAVGITTPHETVPGHAYISFTRPTNAFVNPCQPDEGVLEPALGRTVDDLAKYLTDLPFGATATDVTLSGFAGKHLMWTDSGAYDEPHASCDLALWTTGRTIPWRMSDDVIGRPGYARTELWILDVAGTRLALYATYSMYCHDTVVEPECPPLNIYARARADVQAIVESIHIQPID